MSRVYKKGFAAAGKNTKKGCPGLLANRGSPCCIWAGSILNAWLENMAGLLLDMVGWEFIQKFFWRMQQVPLAKIG